MSKWTSIILLGSLHRLSLVDDKTIVNWAAMAAKRGNYSEETLQEAVRLVQDEGYSYGDVFKLTGILKTTLFKYAKSTVVIKKNKLINHSLIHANKRVPLYMPGYFYNKVPLWMHDCS